MNWLVFSFAFLAANQVSPGVTQPRDHLQFETDIRPILKAYCLDCHGGSEKPKGGLDLRLKRFALSGGSSGPALVPGRPGESLLIERMKQGDMPPGEKKVPADQIERIEKWIKEGAATKRPEPEKLPPGLGISEEDRNWWAFVPLKPPVLEKGNQTSPIDQLVQKKLKEKGLDFNPPATPRELLIRAALDLTGIPPTFEEIQSFEKDKDPNRWAKAVDRLLASPAYGERWGRHWLDVVGYADSEGDGSADSPRDHAWRYRDWTIRALNQDMPLDRFIAQQLAGDELVPKPWNNLTPAQAEILAATGFLRMVPGTSAGDGAEQVMTDTLKVFSASLLGVSVGCAQCHDHRYDPISQVDYFRLRAILEPAVNPGAWRGPGQRLVSLYTDKDRAKANEINAVVAEGMKKAAEREAVLVKEAFEKELQKFAEPQRTKLRDAFNAAADKRTPEQKDLVAKTPSLALNGGVLYQYNQPGADEVKKLRADAEAKGVNRPVEGFVMVLDETGAVPQTKLHYRGDPRQPKNEVLPGDLEVVSLNQKPFTPPAKGPNGSNSGRRLAYAQHLTSGTHPLFGRVMANRIWMHHFGKALVETPAEFGRLGQLPSHPELLDWLALELPAQKWSLKSIHRLILNSRAWQQSAEHSELGDKVDTNNTLIHRYPVRRLEAEILRDRVLAVAGRLDATPFGPPIPVVEHASGQILAPEDKPRRSVYLQQRRSKPIALMGAFDQPVNVVLCEKRVAATNAPQALMLLNGDFIHAQANHLAGLIVAALEKEKIDPKDSEKAWNRAIQSVWKKVLQREATPQEMALSLDLVKSQSKPVEIKGTTPAPVTPVSPTNKTNGGPMPKPMPVVAVVPKSSLPSTIPEKSALAHLTHQLLISNEFLHVP